MGLTPRRHFRGGVFTYEQGGQAYSLRRSNRAIQLALEGGESSLAIIGEDAAIEAGVEGETLEPIKKDGQPLRFALLGRVGVNLASLQSQELIIATSYPVMARRLMTELALSGTLLKVDGCVEAELTGDTPAADVAIELVQSGASVRENNLAVLADDLYLLNLVKIGEGRI